MIKRNNIKFNAVLHSVCGLFLLMGGMFLIISLISTPLFSHASPTSDPFTYGFDFDSPEPDQPDTHQGAANNQYAVNSALNVLSKFSGSTMDESLDNFGVGDPEPTSGDYDDTTANDNLADRIGMITNAGGIPVMTLVIAPPWMIACNPGDTCPGASTNSQCLAYDNSQSWNAQPPCPYYYPQFASLAAQVAKDYPQIKYFVVWSEIRGFANSTNYTYPYGTTNIDIADYTTMYNDVYKAIKAVAPSDQVGGPYTTMPAIECSSTCPSGSLNGAWGYTPESDLVATQYWLQNKVGADFITVDGRTEIASQCSSSESQPYSCSNGTPINVDPATASTHYTAVDDWLRSETNLPIWWMESHIQPAPDEGSYSWTDDQAAAARIATLIDMNTSGATVGQQWQPQDTANWADMGLWTTVACSGGDASSPCGGVATPLANELIPLLSFLEQNRLTAVANQPTGVVAATANSQAVIVNTLNSSANTTVDGFNIDLAPDDVLLYNLTKAVVTYSSSPTPPKVTPLTAINRVGSNSNTVSATGSSTTNATGGSSSNNPASNVIKPSRSHSTKVSLNPTIVANRRKFFYLGYGLVIVGIMNLGAGFLRWVLYLG
jgi:hypothetical protein